MELINTMRQWQPQRAKLWAGALVDAVFEYEVALRGDSVRIGFIDEFSEFLAWGKTDTGKKWKQWSAEMRNIQD
jgi:hypothetical protein